MTTPDSTDTDLSNAGKRYLKERDEARQQATDLSAQVSTLEAVVKDIGLRDKAFRHLASKQVPEAMKWAELAVPRLRDLEDLDDIPATVDAILPEAATTPPPDADAAPLADETPVTDESPQAPPIGGPNPGAPGDLPDIQKLTMSSPEAQAILQKEGIAGIKRAHQEGRLEFEVPLGETTVSSI